MDGYLQSIVFSIVLWKPYKRKEVPLSIFEKLPTVDIFIATYNEPIDLLKRTVTSCTMITYPKELLNIYICDNGHRESVKQLVAEFSVHHITRTENTHAKAVNLNHAILHSKDYFIVNICWTKIYSVKKKRSLVLLFFLFRAKIQTMK